MPFNQYENSHLKASVTRLITKHRGLADETQKVLLSIAFQISEHGNNDQLTRLVCGLSETDSNNKVSLSATARQIGKYMMDHLGLSWDKKNQRFKKDASKEIDFDTACEAMEATRWDKYGVNKADDVFSSDKAWAKIVYLAKQIHSNASVDDPNRGKADTIIRQFQLEA